MYKLIKFDDYRDMFISSVAPPAHKDLNEELRDLSISHILIANKSPLDKYIELIKSVDDSQIELSRLQFLHFCNEVEESFSRSYLYSDEVTKFNHSKDLIKENFKHVVSDFKVCIEKVIKHPNNKKHINALKGCSEFLYQGISVLDVLNLIDKDSLDKVKDYEIKYNYLINDIANVYPNLKKHLLPIETLKKNAVIDVKNQLIEYSELNFDKLNRLKIELGNRDDLWKVVQEIKVEHHRKLSDVDLKDVREKMIEITSAFSHSQKNGFINSIGFILNNLSHRGNVYRDKANSGKSINDMFDIKVKANEALNERMGREFIAPITETEKAEMLIRFKEDKVFTNEYALKLNQYKNEFKQFINTVKINFGLEVNTFQDELVFTKVKDDIIVGNWKNDDTEYLVAYKHYYDDMEQDIISMVKLPKDIFKDVPKLEDVDLKKYSVSSFYTFSQVLSELESSDLQNHLFKKTFQMVDNTEVKKVKKSKQI